MFAGNLLGRRRQLRRRRDLHRRLIPRERVITRQMPPWHIDKTVGIQKFKNDMSLTDEQVAKKLGPGKRVVTGNGAACNIVFVLSSKP